VVIEKACDVQMYYGGYTETRTLNVAHLAGWDMVLCELAVTALNDLIPPGPRPVTIQTEGMAHFALKEWRKVCVATGQVLYAALSIEVKVPDYHLPVFESIVSAMCFGESQEFNRLFIFAQLFPATTPNELPPHRIINHQICPKPGSTWLSNWRPLPSKSYAELTRHLTEKEALGLN